jgi:prolipoprotein diacylglyceryltransferase
MRPVLVAWLARHGLPPWLAPDYMMLVGLSSLLAAILALRRAEREGARVDLHARAFALAYLVAIPGGYLFEAIRMIPAAIAAHDARIVLHAGRAAYGGLIASIGVAVLYMRKRGEPIGPFLERVAVPAGIIFAAVRTGCFLAGCDYGSITASALGVRFPPGSLAAMDHAERGLIPFGAASLPVHATELYEAAVAAFAAVVASRRRHAFATWLAIYATGRFFVEFLRGDVERGSYVGLSTAQWVSLAIVTALVVMHGRSAKRLAIAAALAVGLFTDDASARDPEPAPTAAPPPQPTAPAPSPYPPPPPYGQPYPPPYQPYPPPPYPYYAPPPPTIPKPAPPRVEHTIMTRAVLAGAFSVGREDVPSGGAIEVQGLYIFRTAAKSHIGLGLEYRYWGNVKRAPSRRRHPREVRARDRSHLRDELRHRAAPHVDPLPHALLPGHQRVGDALRVRPSIPARQARDPRPLADRVPRARSREHRRDQHVRAQDVVRARLLIRPTASRDRRITGEAVKHRPQK